jgi:hypothetical protein
LRHAPKVEGKRKKCKRFWWVRHHNFFTNV